MARYIKAVECADIISERFNIPLSDLVDVFAEIPTADVVPKSEVDNWYQLYHSIKEELKQEKMYHRETDKLCDRYCIESQQAKRQVAREIFEEIRKRAYSERGFFVVNSDIDDFIAELKKKYTA